MKLKALLAGLALVCGQALATPVTWTDTVNPNADVLIGGLFGLPSLSITFNITDGANGYRPGIDSISSYSVSVNLRDDGGFLDGVEKADVSARSGVITFLGFPIGYNYATLSFTNLGGSESAPVTAYARALLNDTGLLTIWISADYGDFIFDSATLTANGNQVPEPSSMLLLGAALTAASLAARRRKQQ